MARTVRQKRRNRSSRPTVRPNTGRSKKQLNPTGNSIVARNWDKKQTLTQNYRRLGLLTRLQKPAGGVERHHRLADEKDKPQQQQTSSSSAAEASPFRIETGAAAVVGEVRVERDAEGRILRVLNGKGRKNPLGDPLNDLDSDSESGSASEAEEQRQHHTKQHEIEWGGFDDDVQKEASDSEEEEEEERDNGRPRVIRELERQARRPVARTPRRQSEREREWLARLVARHGDDTEAMARDRRLNPMQQTAADIARRIRKMRRETGGSGGGGGSS